jgi:hypothetical protein
MTEIDLADLGEAAAGHLATAVYFDTLETPAAACRIRRVVTGCAHRAQPRQGAFRKLREVRIGRNGGRRAPPDSGLVINVTA